MKKLLFILLVFISCKKETTKNKPLIKKINLTKSQHIQETPIKTYTLYFEKSNATSSADKAIISLLKKVFDKDSIGTSYFKIDVYNKNKVKFSQNISIQFGSEEGYWHINEDIMSNEKEAKTDYRFFELSYGYDACGYTQTNFLFFTDENTSQLILKSESMADGGYGVWTEIESKFRDATVTLFTTKTISIDNDESKPYNDENEDLIKSYSDSVVYTFNSNKWNANEITSKGKIFRKEFKTFNNIYKQE